MRQLLPVPNAIVIFILCTQQYIHNILYYYIRMNEMCFKTNLIIILIFEWMQTMVFKTFKHQH